LNLLFKKTPIGKTEKMIYFKTQVKLLLFAILFFAAAAGIFAAEGDLDVSFDGDGIVITDNGSGTEEIRDLAVQTDGKIIAVGYSPVESSPTMFRAVVVRYNSNGSVDSNFGESGKVIIEQLVNPQAIALQPNGKIVIVGSTGFFPNNDFYVVRLNTDGGFDTTFNGTGAVTLDLGFADVAFAVRVQPDGKIIAGGTSGSPITSSYAIVRFNPNGSLDTSFDSDGKVLTRIDQLSRQESFADLIIQRDGKIVGVGTAILGNPDGSAISAFVTVRYNADGSLDTSFDGDGRVFTQMDANTLIAVRSVAVQSSGKIIVGGTGLVRYNPDGSLDTSFGTGGKIPTPRGSDIEIQADNKILLALYSGGVARFNVNGAPDTSFSGDGQNVIPFSSPAGINASVVQPDGKIVIGGFIGNADAQDFLLARFEASSCSANCFPLRQRVADFDGDGKTDLSVFRDGTWLVNPSSANNRNSFYGVRFGLATDKLAPADYDGDGRTDFAVFRENPADPGKANFYILQSSNNQFREEQFGASGDVPVPGYWDDDDKADLAVYRPGTQANPQSYFFYRPSSQPSVNFISIPFGIANDKPVVADYDGDGRTDTAVFRPSNGVWYIQTSKDRFYAVQFGTSGDKPVVGDYDGDGRADQAVFRPSNGFWYVLGSRDNSFSAIQFGISTDKPVPGDYDGNGTIDYAVYRDGNWYILNITNGFVALAFGNATDRPIPNSFIP
jgi:uncharacterized delta-60 repeat protein